MLKRRNKCTWTMMEDSRTNHNDDNKTSDSHWTSKHKDRKSEETDWNIGLTLPYLLCLSQARTLISNAICCGVFEFNGLVWKTVVLGDCCSCCLYWWNFLPSLLTIYCNKYWMEGGVKSVYGISTISWIKT
jgi:hypothetical protein